MFFFQYKTIIGELELANMFENRYLSEYRKTATVKRRRFPKPISFELTMNINWLLLASLWRSPLTVDDDVRIVRSDPFPRGSLNQWWIMSPNTSGTYRKSHSTTSPFTTLRFPVAQRPPRLKRTVPFSTWTSVSAMAALTPYAMLPNRVSYDASTHCNAIRSVCLSSYPCSPSPPCLATRWSFLPSSANAIYTPRPICSWPVWQWPTAWSASLLCRSRQCTRCLTILGFLVPIGVIFGGLWTFSLAQRLSSIFVLFHWIDTGRSPIHSHIRCGWQGNERPPSSESCGSARELSVFPRLSGGEPLESVKCPNSSAYSPNTSDTLCSHQPYHSTCLCSWWYSPTVASIGPLSFRLGHSRWAPNRWWWPAESSS